MTLLYMDSFDYLPAAGTNLSGSLLFPMNYYNVTDGFRTIAGAFGGLGIELWGGGVYYTNYYLDLMPPSIASGISEETVIGMRMAWGGWGTQCSFGVLNSGDGFSKFGIACSSYGELLLIKSDGTVLARSAPGTIVMFAWNYIEIKFTISSGGTGRVRVRINTDLVIDYTGTLSPVGASTWNVLRWYAHGESPNMRWDDLYVLTTSGTDANDYLGNVRVRMQLPSGPGDITQLTPTGAATNWQAQINPSLNTGIYDSTATVGNYDLYALQANAAARNIYGVQVRGTFLQDNATQLKGSFLMKTGGTEYESPHFSLSGGYDTYYGIWGINPHSSVPWTNSDLNALQAGPKLAESA